MIENGRKDTHAFQRGPISPTKGLVVLVKYRQPDWCGTSPATILQMARGAEVGG